MNKNNVIAFLFMCGYFGTLSAQTFDGNKIVSEMDRRLNFPECRMVIRIIDSKASGSTREMKADVEYLENVGTRLEFTEPAREKGKKILMAGSSMWMSVPSVSKPVRLSGKDSFMGTSFTNDDAMNMDKSDDYDSVIVASDEAGWDIVMTAKNESVPYPRIEARIDRNYLPLRQSFFVRSGKLSRKVEYSEVRTFDGRDRPSVMIITDLMSPGDSSKIVFESIKSDTISASRFTSASLSK